MRPRTRLWTHDNTKDSYREFMRHWRYDPKLGREREFSDAELKQLEQQSVGKSAAPAHNDGTEGQWRTFGTRYRTTAEVEAEERRQKVVQAQQRERARRRAEFEANEHFVEAELAELTIEERTELMNALAARGLANDLNTIQLAVARIRELKQQQGG